MDEISTLAELASAVRDSVTGGYDVEFEFEPNRDAYRIGTSDSFFLVINVSSNEPYSPGCSINGQWWFDPSDMRVEQVL